MSVKFLSDGWFAKLAELRAGAGDVETPAEIAALVINLTITGIPGDHANLALVGGFLARGHREDAGISMMMSAGLAKRIFIDGDELAGLQGFMAGQIRLEGDASKLRVFHAARAAGAQLALQQKIREVTA